MTHLLTTTITDYKKVKQIIKNYDLNLVIKGRKIKGGRIVYVELIGGKNDYEILTEKLNNYANDLSKERALDFKIMFWHFLGIMFTKFAMAIFILGIVSFFVKLTPIIEFAIGVLIIVFFPVKISPEVLKISKKYTTW